MGRGLIDLLRLLPVFCLLAAAPVTAAGAAFQTEVEVPVIIQGGGTAVIKPVSGAPVSARRTLTLKDGKKGCFRLRFQEPGDYRYRIVQNTGNNASVSYDTAVYRVNVHIMATEDELSGICVIESKAGKTDAVRFVNTNQKRVQGHKRPPAVSTGTGLTRLPGVQTSDPGPQFLVVLLAAAGTWLVLLRKRMRKKGSASETVKNDGQMTEKKEG